MPRYRYINEDGERDERVCDLGKAPETIKINGKKAWRDFKAEMVGVPATKGWPLECIGSGVNASQAGELRQYLADKGVPTEVTSDGNPVYRNANHRKKALRARGMFDKSAFI